MRPEYLRPMGRREDNKRRKREALLAAGLSVFSAEGYDRASIEQIAKVAGVARGTYYLYFEDKTALFQALIRPWVDELLGIVAEVDAALGEATDADQAREIYEQMGLGIALLGLNERDGVLLAFRESRRSGEAGDFLRSEEARIFEAVVGMTQRAADRGLIGVRDAAITVRLIVGAVERIYFDVLTGVDLGDPTEVAAEVVRTFMVALGLSPAS